MYFFRKRFTFLQLVLCTGLILALYSCSKAPRSVETVTGQFIVRDFIPLANWHYNAAGKIVKKDLADKAIKLDYSDAFTNGFIIPTRNQVEEGRFEFEFMVKNVGSSPQTDERRLIDSVLVVQYQMSHN